MRKPVVPLCIIASLAVLLFFSQPPVYGEEHLVRSSILEALHPDTVTVPSLPDGIAGRSFYNDYLVRPGPETDLLLVATEDLPEPLLRAVLRLGTDPATDGPQAAVLLVAPRYDPADAGRVAAHIMEVPPSVPRVFLRAGEPAEWTVSVPRLVTPVWFARLLGTHTATRINSAQLNAAHLGFGREDAALRAALAANITAARLTVDEADRLREDITSLAAELAATRTEPRAPDRNYLLIPLRNPVILSEFVIVQALILLAIALISYSIILPRRVLHYLRSMGRNFAAILISLFVIMVSLMVANLALRLVGRIPRISPPPLLLVGGKIALGALVLSLLATLTGHRVRRATAVYSGAAVLFLLVGAIVSGAVSIILGAYFTVSFFFGVLFSLGRTAWFKAICLLLALAPIVYLILALAPAADHAMAAALLTPPLAQEAVTSIMLLPMLLMFFRLDSITSRTPMLPIIAMIATIGLALVAATLIVQARNPDPYELVMVDRFPPDTTAWDDPFNPSIPLEGERVITAGTFSIPGPIEIRLPGEDPFDCEAIPCIRDLEAPAPPVRAGLEHIRVLDRHTVRWSVQFDESAETIEIVLLADQPVQLYATDQPTHQPVGSRETRFEFETGPQPPREIRGSVVLRPETQNTRVGIRVTSRFSGGASAPDQDFNLTHQGRTWMVGDAIVLE